MQSVNDQVHVTVSSSPRIPKGPCFLSDIICHIDGTEFFIVERGSSIFLLLLAETNGMATSWSTDDAALHCADFMSGSSRSTLVCFFNDEECYGGECSSTERRCEKALKSACSLSVLSIHDPASTSVSEWQADLLTKSASSSSRLMTLVHSTLDSCGMPKLQMSGRKAVLGTVLVTVLLILILVVVSTLWITRDSGIWQRYNIGNSIGPRYQLQFTHHNVSSWAAKYQSPQDDWYMRIDDQAMVPLSLVDENERRYQRWFQDRYPEANEIRLRDDYLKESFLGDYLAIQVPADKQFHMAHCVLALRRYWWAKESGRHVCPRDIDHKHMQHCLDALDSWAFPEGPRRSFPGPGTGQMTHHHGQMGKSDRHQRMETSYTVDETDETRLVWRTKVCFDDASIAP
jgi:hypothetical protein